MNVFSSIRRSSLLLATAAAIITVQAREPELTGIYDDAGTVVTAAPGRSAQDVASLHALLSLEFVPGLARLLHDRTGEVRLTHTPGQLAVEVVNRDGEVGWQESWKQGKDYAVRGDRVVLHFRPGKFGQDEFVLMLETVTAHRLLQVEVQRLKPTFFGPVYQPMGTYLFHRAE
ncbi:MAG TPA: hypothetical protein VHN79_13060 [Lacunisphaera sp.]|nr:hypothetical protein [Lacunisphaera sp.]